MNSFLSSCAAYGAFLLCVVYAVQGCMDGSGNCEQTQVNAAALQSIPCAVAADCPDLGLECVVPECVGADSAEGGVCRYHNAAVPNGLPPAIYEATYACRAWCAKGTAGSGQGGSGGQGGGAGGNDGGASGGSSSGGGGPVPFICAPPCDDGNFCTTDVCTGKGCQFFGASFAKECTIGDTGTLGTCIWTECHASDCAQVVDGTYCFDQSKNIIGQCQAGICSPVP